MHPNPINTNPKHRRQRGIALLLVMISVAVASVLSLGFLTAQTTTLGISRNITHSAQARAIAESALELALHYVRDDPTAAWRTDRPHGVWVADQPLAGGTYTITAIDGADTNGDGTISAPSEGDGDLTDDGDDPLTLTATATYGGVTYTVTAVVTPISLPEPELLGHWKFDDASGDTAADSSGNGYDGDLIHGPTWTTGQTSGALQLDGNNDHVQIPGFPNATGSFTMTSWVRSTTAGGDQRIFVDDHDNNESGYALSIGDGGTRSVRFFSRGVNPVIIDTPVVLTADAWHYVVGVHDADARQRRIYVDGQLVAQDSAGGYSNTWGTDSGEAAIGGEVDGSPEAVPNWRFGGKIDEVRFYNTALTAAQIVAVGNITGGVVAVADSILLQDHARIDAFDSTLGAYGGANILDCSISTNSTALLAAQLFNNAVIQGDLAAGPGALLLSVIGLSGTAAITGVTDDLDHPAGIHNIVNPSHMPASTGDALYTGSTTQTLSGDLHCDRFEIRDSAIVQISGDVTVLCDDTFIMDDTAQLQLLDGATLTLYLDNGMEMYDTTRFNENTQGPSNAVIYALTGDPMIIQDNAQLHAMIYAPYAQLLLKNGADVFGGFVGDSLRLENAARLHQDLAAQVSGLINPGYTYRVSWPQPQ